MINIVLYGPPGAGKGTQAAKLLEEFDLTHLATGDLLRSEVEQKTELGLKAKALMDQGQLVPDEVVIGMIKSRLNGNKDINGFIFDGFPRTVAQAEALDNLLKEEGFNIDLMLALEVDEEELTKRILERGKVSGRSDDQDISIVTKRIEEYNKKTAPVADYYKQQGKFKSIYGIGEIEEIFEKLSSEIKTVLAK